MNICIHCEQQTYKNNLCRTCFQKNGYHCTWPNCLRPVFTLTLCRTHYRHINVNCAHQNCNRPSYCKQICAHHYRKKEFLPIKSCQVCQRPEYMDQKCFYHFTSRTCTKCGRKVFSKQLCRRHYMRHWRNQRLCKTGPTTNKDNKDDANTDTPEMTNHIPETYSSLLQSDILK